MDLAGSKSDRQSTADRGQVSPPAESEVCGPWLAVQGEAEQPLEGRHQGLHLLLLPGIIMSMMMMMNDDDSVDDDNYDDDGDEDDERWRRL